MRASKAGCLALLVLVVLVAACQKQFRITVNDAGDQSPEFRFEPVTAWSGEGVRITYFYVLESNPEQKLVKTMWGIVSVDDIPRRLLNVRYGVVPAGFIDTTAPVKLVAGSRYSTLSGMPGTVGGDGFVLK